MIDIALIIFHRKGKKMKLEETFSIRWDFQNMMYGFYENQNFDIIMPKEKEVHAVVYIHGRQ